MKESTAKKRLDAVMKALRQEINLCKNLQICVLDPLGQSSARGRRNLAQQVLKIAKGESDE